MDDGDLRAGRLLIASPTLEGSTFARSLVLLLDVDEGGALGVVLNRPSPVGVADVLDRWQPLVSPPAVFFSGGPVEPEGALGVAQINANAIPPPGFRPLFDDTGLVDLDEPVEDCFDAVRIYAGYAGWGEGQLEAEVAEGAWYVVPGKPCDFATRDPDALWRQVLRRQPEPLAMLLTMPADPRVN
jgi:putative transcriptional regulator